MFRVYFGACLILILILKLQTTQKHQVLRFYILDKEIEEKDIEKCI